MRAFFKVAVFTAPEETSVINGARTMAKGQQKSNREAKKMNEESIFAEAWQKSNPRDDRRGK